MNGKDWTFNLIAGTATAIGWHENIPEVVTVTAGLSVIAYNGVQTYYKILEKRKKK